MCVGERKRDNTVSGGHCNSVCRPHVVTTWFGWFFLASLGQHNQEISFGVKLFSFIYFLKKETNSIAY